MTLLNKDDWRLGLMDEIIETIENAIVLHDNMLQIIKKQGVSAPEIEIELKTTLLKLRQDLLEQKETQREVKEILSEMLNASRKIDTVIEDLA